MRLKKALTTSIVVVIAAILLMDVAAALTPSPIRTRAYFSLSRTWWEHWPWQAGHDLPLRLTLKTSYLAPVRMEVEPHVNMLLDPEDLIPRTILATGAWEPDSWSAIAQRLRTGDTFVDIGAHIGYYTLKAASTVGASGRVLAVEPNPRTLKQLQDNVQASNATAVTIFPFACSDSEGILELFAAPSVNTGESSLSRANASQEGAVVVSYKVRARPLDDIVREAKVSRVDVIKVDVEGAEYLVLKGASETLARFHPMLIAEVLDDQLKAMGSSVEKLDALLNSLGYKPGKRYGQNVVYAFGS
jgi:FkbM family methyltransferase